MSRKSICLTLQAYMVIHIKNMVCDRCKMAIKDALNKLGLLPESIELGVVYFGQVELNTRQLQQIKNAIEPLGFELLDDKASSIVGQIKAIIIELVHNKNTSLKVNFSDYLADKLYYDYNYLSNLFSSIEGVTIEHYLIQQKIEKVKELLVYNELTLSEIAFQLEYSSIAHLSSQFKKVTGLTPSYFKKIKDTKQRVPLDKL
jgi:AraC-like DNA-binding protein